jgi:hypothetical protein
MGLKTCEVAVSATRIPLVLLLPAALAFTIEGYQD